MQLRRRGIALILTLMVSTILCMLAGAFIGVNEANIRLMGSQELHRKALEAAQSGVEYAKMRMEQCSYWADPNRYVPEKAPRPNIWPAMQIHEVREGSDDRGPAYKVVGVLNGGESHFQMLFIDPTADNITYAPLAGANGMFRHESIVNNPEGPPELWSYNTCANADISVNYMMFRPQDPILMMDPEYPDTNNPPAFANSTNRCVRPRRCRIVVYGYCKGIVKRVEVSFGPVELTDASMCSGGTMALSVSDKGQWVIDSLEGDNQVKANGNFYGPAVTVDHQGIKFGSMTAGGTVRATQDIHLSDKLKIDYLDDDDTIDIGGEGDPLSASERDAAGKIAQGEFVKGSSGVNMPPVGAEDVENLAKIDADRRMEINAGEYRFTNHNEVEEYSPGGALVKKHTNTIPDKSGKGTAIHLRDGKFIIPNKCQVSVDGSMMVNATAGLGFKPTVAIGYNSSGTLPHKAVGVLKVGGNLNVNNGTVLGSGSVVATGKTGSKMEPGNITIAGKSDMSAEPDTGVTMYANATVKITKASQGTYEDVDFTTFKAATSSFAPGNWTNNKQMNDWGKLDLPQKMVLAGNVTPSVVNDTQVTAATGTPGAIRTTDISASLGALNDSNSALNVLVNQYDFVKGDTVVLKELNNLLDTFKTGEGEVGGKPLNVGAPGISPGRYIRLREWLRSNDEHLREGYPENTNAGTLSDMSAAWADCEDQFTNEKIGHKLINQLDYYERQRGNYGIHSLQSFFGKAENPIEIGEVADASFRGLIFSNGNIFCDLAGGNFFVDGGMIAKKVLAVANAKSVYTRYNPMYMDQLTKELYLNKGWKKLAITYWASDY